MLPLQTRRGVPIIFSAMATGIHAATMLIVAVAVSVLIIAVMIGLAMRFLVELRSWRG